MTKENIHHYSIYSLILLIILVSLTSCTSNPRRGNSTTLNVELVNSGVETEDASLQLITLLELAANAETPQAENIYLQASQILISLGRHDEAGELLKNIEIENLSLTLAAEILLQRAQLLLSSNQPSLALEILESPRLRLFSQLSKTQQINYRLLRAQSYLASNLFLDSAQERIYMDKLLNPNDLAQNHEYIWTALDAVTLGDLENMSLAEINFEFQGWYELGVIGKAYQYNLDRQLLELERWRQRWTRHPASSYLPQALQLIETMARERPQQIALLLPLGSKAGNVIRDGFMSAYFSVQSIGGSVPSIRFYDTSGITDIAALHQRAIDEGAALIIGPLLRDNVARLQKVSNLGVPTLALNNIEGVQPASDLLYQFSLSPENEAQQIAIRAWRDGHRHAAILSPRDDAGSDFYARKRNSFIQTWEALGGRIASREIFQNNYTEAIETLLDLGESQYRMELLSDLINQDLEFAQRRRQDIDFIFLIAQPIEARQIHPRFSYLYAGDIPVYASQDVYEGIYRPLEDADLNGIQFSDSPWLLSDNDELKLITQTLFPQSTARNLRLQAFGIDAFRLYPRLKQLESVPESQIYGATGRLHFGTNQNIIRELSWARIQQGQARPFDQPDQ